MRTLPEPGGVECDTYGVTQAERPWWQLTTSPTFGFVQCGIWVVMAAYQWAALVTGETDDNPGRVPERAIFAVLCTSAAAAYLASAIRLRRRLKRHTDDEAGLSPDGPD